MLRYQKSPCFTYLPIVALVVAWLFASLRNIGPALLFTWFAHARTFAHQQNLSSDVANLLTGQSTKLFGEAKALAKRTERDPNSIPVKVAGQAMKKIELKCEAGDTVLVAPRSKEQFAPVVMFDTGKPRKTPPHGPPRA